MLTHIHITNYALVDSLSLDFSDQLSVLTGETGAGKSIWIDAISLALGARADAGVISPNKPRCNISLCFNIAVMPQVKEWLQQHQFDQVDSSDECIICRTVQVSGPSRSTINGQPCPLHLVRELADQLLLIHSQHQYQKILQTQYQRKVVDQYASNHNLLSEIETLYQQWLSDQHQLDLLRAKARNSGAELSLLQYQLQELVELDLKPNEWEEACAQHQKLHNAKDLIQQLQMASELTISPDQECAATLLQQAITHLQEVEFADEQLNNIRELLNTALIHLQEAGSELSQYSNQLDLSHDNLSRLEQRISLMSDLARKHHVNPQDLTATQNSLQQRIDELNNIDANIAQLEQQQAQQVEHYQKIASKLTVQRKKTASILSKKITQQMQQLGIKGGKFVIKLVATHESMTQYGQENIEFWIQTNPGHPLALLTKVISGGELSRISLIIQMLTAKQLNLPTLIFDEVDIGIGGQTAHVVGGMLQTLAQATQVLCITHLPQVAAHGSQHYKVIKTVVNKKTHSDIQLLSKQQRIEEISRMLGGNEDKKHTKAHAAALLKPIIDS